MVTPLLISGLLFAQTAALAPPKLREETLKWRFDREALLKADRGWLAVSGLPWLKEGDTSLGSGPEAAVRLADGPAHFGMLRRHGFKVELHPAAGSIREITTADPPFRAGRTWVQLIRRGDRIGLRLWDPENARKIAFPGLEWYEVKPEYRVVGRLTPFKTPRSIKIANVIGQVNDFEAPGVVDFELEGRKLQLTPVYETAARDELFYIFKDQTAGRTTYGAGRFVYSGLPDENGDVVLDFNRAYSPPCAFTDFATCPLPPPVNRLSISIEAGEKDPHKAH